jgi:GGDEF domain-containing protein
MTARPPRASTRGEGKRPKSRGMTHGDKVDKRRAASVVPTDQFERVSDDEVLEETELPEVPQLRIGVLEAAVHLGPAQSAIAAAGHAVVVGTSGRDGIEQLRPAVGDVDALLVGLPGGEPLIDAALALGARRPVVIVAATAGAVEAVRRATVAGADLATVRPHHVERLAPILLAAARLAQRFELHRQLAAPADALQGALEELADPEPAALQPFELFQRAVELEIERSRRNAYPLTIAMFGVDIGPLAQSSPGVPPGVRGILRARAGNALVHAIREVDLATEIDQDRFLVLLPHTDRRAGAEIARRIISAVAAGDPVIAGGRTFPPRVIGAVAGARPGEPLAFSQLLHDATQLLEQAQVTGASLAVET